MRSMSCGPGALSSVLIIVVLIVSGCNVNFGEWPTDADGDGDADSDADGDLDPDADAEDADFCEDVSCGDHGECRIQDGEATCVCDPRWYGHNCEDCYPGYHPRDGDCVLDQECLETSCASFEEACRVVDHVVMCECPEGYDDDSHCAECSDGYHREGESCEINFTCEEFRGECTDHETCVEDEEAGTAWCICAEGYGGEDCSLCLEGYHHEDDDCLPNVSCGDIVCVHGSCEEFADGTSRCMCHTGYVGDDCSECADGYHEIDDDRCEPNETCDDYECSEHATCTVLGGEAICICNDGYEGDGCEDCSEGYNANGDRECVLAYCGDGFEDPGEECDEGDANAFDGLCLQSCETAECGDGEVCSNREACGDLFEYCDDGNTEYGDECAGDCLDGERIIETVAGGGVCDRLPAKAASINSPHDIAVGESGFYVGDRYRVRYVTNDGIIETRIGTGIKGDISDSGPATKIRISSTAGLAFISDTKNLFLADMLSCRISILEDGFIHRYLGTGECSASDVPRDRLSASTDRPVAVNVAKTGQLIFVDYGSQRIRVVGYDNIVRTVAGTGVCGLSGDGGPAKEAQLCNPYDATQSEDGKIWIADSVYGRIRLVDTSGNISTFVKVSYPSGVSIFGKNLLIGTSGSQVYSIPQSGGDLTCVAGCAGIGFSGDGSLAVDAQMDRPFRPEQMKVGASTLVVVNDYHNNRIRRFAIGGIIETIAGNGFANYCGDVGSADEFDVDPPEGGWDYSATNAALNSPRYVAVLDDGTLVWTEQANNVVRVRYPDDDPDHPGDIDTIVGITAGFSSPSGLARCEEDGDVYLVVADTGNDRLRRIDIATGEVEDFITGLAGPIGMASRMVGGECYVYVAETEANRVSVIDGGGSRRTYIGPGSIELDQPQGLAIDSDGTIYLADSGNNVVLRVRATENPLLAGTVSDFAGSRDTSSYVGDDGDPLLAGLLFPIDVAVDPSSGAVFVSDSGHNVIRVVREEGGRAVIQTAAGNGACTMDGDLGPATSAALCSPAGVAVDGYGGLYIADYGNNRIRHAYFEALR